MYIKENCSKIKCKPFKSKLYDLRSVVQNSNISGAHFLSIG